MHKTITVSFPFNTSEDEKPYFRPYLSYELASQKVKYFKNVFVTYSGFCMNGKGLIRESHHDNPHQLDDYLSEAARYYYDVSDHPENLIVLDDNKTYLLIHHPWYNYYHWLCECIFRAWMVQEKKDKMVLLLPDYYEKSDFIMGPLEPFGFKNIYFIPVGKSVIVRNLCLPQIKAKVDSYDYKMVGQVRRFLLEYLKTNKKTDLNLGDKIYISRKRASRKRVYNEDEIEPILIKHGFTIINNEDYTFWEQVAIYSQARYLVSIHGSGLTNMLFMQDRSHILELRKRVTNDRDWYSPAFWYLAEAIGFKYYQQLCEPTDVNDDYFNANYIANLILLDRNLTLMCGQ
jgi:capsular polysaccharide biosynthesis protein